MLDSSIVIAAERRGHTVRQLLEQLEATHGQIDIGLSVVTIAEMMHGAWRAKDEADRQRRLAFVDPLAIDIPVYPFTVEIARHLGQIEGQLAVQGLTVSFEDLIIGVTALYLDFKVLTGNLRHFRIIPGLTAISG